MNHCALTQPNKPKPTETNTMNTEQVKDLLKQCIEKINAQRDALQAFAVKQAAQAQRITDLEAMIDQLTDWQTDIQRELSRNHGGDE